MATMAQIRTLKAAGYDVCKVESTGEWLPYLDEDQGDPSNQIAEDAGEGMDDVTADDVTTEGWHDRLWTQCWKHSQRKFPFFALIRWNGKSDDVRLISLGKFSRISGHGERPFYQRVANMIDGEGCPVGDSYAILMDELGYDYPILKPHTWIEIKSDWRKGMYR